MMDTRKIISLPTRRKIESEAVQWFVRLDRGEVTPVEQAEFERWYACSIEARDAFQAVQQLWQADLGLLAGASSRQAADNDIYEHSQAVEQKSRFLPRQAAIAASLFLAVAMGTLAVQHKASESEVSRSTYLTGATEQQRITLPDGSMVIVNTSSRFATVFDDKARRVEFAAGEAHFVVAKDAGRPFIVTTPSGTATAIGTEFSVRVSDSGVDVLVTEGRVAVAKKKGSNSFGRASRTVEVVAGQTVSMPMQPAALAVKSLSPDSLERQIDWQDGTLSFRGEPLAEVVASIERHSNLQIEIEGEELGSERIYASYRIGEVEPLREALEIAAGIESQWIGANKLRIFRRQAQQSDNDLARGK